MSKGRLAKLQKKIDALKGATGEVTNTVLEPVAYSVKVNGRKFRATGHNTTAEFFIINTADGKLIFFPQRRLRKVVIGPEYQELMRQRALANVPKVPKAGLTMVPRPPLVVPGSGETEPDDA